MLHSFEQVRREARAGLTKLNVATGLGLSVANTLVLWPRTDLMAVVLVIWGLAFAFNGVLSLVVLPRVGAAICEVARTAVNVTVVTWVAHATAWPATMWAWMLFSATAMPLRSLRLHVAQLMAWVVPMGAVAILDGVTPWVPLVAVILSIHLVRAARLAHATTDKALSEHEDRLATIIENIGDGICSVDRDLRIVAVNGAFRDFVRWRRGDELAAGDPLFPAAADEVTRGWRQRFERALAGEVVPRGDHRYTRGAETRTLESALHPVRDGAGIIGVTLVNRDVTASRALLERAEVLQRQLLEIGRKAGVAEVATGVLHDVGNVLNSVNVAASLLAERVRTLDTWAVLTRLSDLLAAHAADLAGFFAGDPRGKLVPALIAKLAASCAADREILVSELAGLRKNLEHVKVMLSVQQSQARALGTSEKLDLAAVIEDAIAIASFSDARHGVEVVRRYGEVPPTLGDRHKLLQILMNLLSNARHAVRHSGRHERRIEVRLAREGDEVTIAVEDNGYGIAPENLPRIFSHGFTTKPDGHGFGLHASAAAAKELGGGLHVTSEAGRGACFTLRFPLAAIAAAA